MTKLRSINDIDKMIGGTALISDVAKGHAGADSRFADLIGELETYPFWTRGDADEVFRPGGGLWAPQRKAVAFALAYLAWSSQQPATPGVEREAALVKMPTGTGKSGVIATLACCAGLQRVIILTPRRALVNQMRSDLAWRFWGRFGHIHSTSGVHPRADADPADTTKINSESETTIALLRREGYRRIWNGRSAPRQVIVGTFNALHAVLGLQPPAHRSMLHRKAPKPAEVLRHCVKEGASPDDEAGASNFRALLRQTDLLIVDEGHYEPAFSWAQCVDEIGAPTLILTATPYRNDYKYFNMNGRFAYNLSFEEAVGEKLIRQVQFEARPPMRDPAGEARDETLEEFVAFVAGRAKTLGCSREGRPLKLIVHAGDYGTLKKLQRAIHAAAPDLPSLLIHDAHKAMPTQTEHDCNSDLKLLDRKAAAALAALRFRHVSQALGGEGPQVPVWIHQYKLLEGVDNADFIEVHLYDGFASARQLVQQAGRALRFDDAGRAAPETAHVFGALRVPDPASGRATISETLREQWQGYLDYEQYAARAPDRVFTAETQLLALIKKTAPDTQYSAGMFRQSLFIGEEPTLDDYVLPRRAMICLYSAGQHGSHDPSVLARPDAASADGVLSDHAFDRLAADCVRAMAIEERFDIRTVTPGRDAEVNRNVRLIRYLKWSASKLLQAKSLPEWKLGLMAIVRMPPFVFLLDTEGLCIDFGRLGFHSPDASVLKRLFSERPDYKGKEERVRIVEAAATGLDLSDIAIRAMSVRKRSLSGGYFDLAESSQAPSSVHGVALLGERTVRRELSLRKSRVSDPVHRNLPLRDYVDWTRAVAEILGKTDSVENPLFGRFAREVGAPSESDGEAQSILFDVWDLLNPDDGSFDSRAWNPSVARELVSHDTCCEVKRSEDGKLGFSFAGFSGTVSYLRRETTPPSGRYQIRLDGIDAKLDRNADQPVAISELSPFGGRKRPGTSLVALINSEQAFRILPKQGDIVYANGLFFKPDIDWEAIGLQKPGNLLEILESDPYLAGLRSEKGDDGDTTSADWNSSCQFGRIVSAFRKPEENAKFNPLFGRIAKADLLICDDGSQEKCDFFLVDRTSRYVALIHAKAGSGNPGVSLGNLQVVGRQASASLAFAGASRSRFPMPDNWNKPLVIKARPGKRQVAKFNRVLAKEAITAREGHELLQRALGDPEYRREVWIVTTGLVSKEKAVIATGTNPTAHGRQFAYYIADLRTAFGRANVACRLFCER